jgi:ribosomal protein L11 methyltransferase
MIRLAVRVRREQAELVLAELLELAPSGVEEVEVGPGVVEFAVYGAPGELPALPDLRASAGGALVEVDTREVADDWAQRWREFHRPVVIAGRLGVRPPWEPAADAPIDLVIDPGQAFGTGAHATTRLCLELMLELDPARGPFIDLGCGSGVLAIAAARLGYAPVLALDHDPASVEAAIDNARANGVAVEVRRHDLRVDPLPRAGKVADPAPVAGTDADPAPGAGTDADPAPGAGTDADPAPGAGTDADPAPGAGTDADPAPAAGTVAANLLGPLLREWAARLGEAGAGAGAVPGRLIAGGLLTHEAGGIAAAFGAVGLREIARRESGEWAALLLERPARVRGVGGAAARTPPT